MREGYDLFDGQILETVEHEQIVWVWETEERLEEEGAGRFGFEGGVG